MVGWYALLVLFAWLFSSSSMVHAQRLSHERVDTAPRLQYSRYDALLCNRQGQAFVTGYNQGPSDGFSHRLFTPALDTVWTHHRYSYAGWQELRQSLQGGYIGLGLIQNPPYAGAGSQSGQDVLLEKIALNGRISWSRFFDFNRSPEFGVGLIELPNTHILVTVGTGNVGRQQIYVLLTDSAGQEIRRVPYGWGGIEAMVHTQTSATGRILAAGYTLSGATPAQLKLLEFDRQGDSIRGRLLAPLGPGRDARTADSRNSLLPLTDGGWLLTGYRDTTRLPDLPFVLRLDSLLQPQWTRLWQPPTPQAWAYGGSCELRDGSVLVLARQTAPLTPSFALHRYSATGQLTHIYPLTSAVAGTAVAPYLLAPALDGRTLFVAGYSNPTLTSQQSYVATIDLQGLPGAVVLSSPVPAPSSAPLVRLDLYPNPATAQVTVRYSLPPGSAETTLCLYDATGQLVRRLALAGRGGEALLVLAGLRPGLYLAAMTAAGVPVATSKFFVTP